MITKKLVSLVMAVLLLHAVGVVSLPAFARTTQGEERAAKVRAEVARRGVGKKAGVRVRLQNGEKLKGYISQTGQDSFTVTDKDGQTRTLAYGDVTEVKGRGGLSLGAKLGIGAGILVGVLAIVYAAGCGGDSNVC